MTCEQLAADVLGADTDVNRFATQTFVGLGGDSLRAMRLAALAEERLGVRLTVAALLGDEPLARVLAEAVAAGTGAAPGDGDRVAEQRPEAAGGFVSHAQRGMWFVERMTGGSPYNLVFICFVEDGQLIRETFEQAVGESVARHESLRTVFQERDGDVVRRILPSHTPAFTVLESTSTLDGFEDFVHRTVAQQCHRPFDLSSAPALRFLWLSHPAGRQAIVLAAHHMVLDGWAVGLLLREVFGRYDALESGAAGPAPGPGVSMRVLLDHQDRLRARGELDRQAQFWLTQLHGAPRVLELPADRQRPQVQDASGARVPLDLGAAVTGAVTERARQLGVTPYSLLLAAFGLTLSRWTGERRLLVGVPLLGRGTSELAELVAVAGNLVPTRIDVDDDDKVADYLRSVYRSLVLSIEAGDLPFEELVARLDLERSLDRHPLVQACFGMHDQLVPSRVATRSARIRIEEGHGGGSQFDLTLLVGRSEPALAGYVEYATSVWSPEEVSGFVADFRAAVEQLATAADIPLEEVRCISRDRRAFLDKINETGWDFSAASIDGVFREVAQRRPDTPAVRDGVLTLTYSQLARAAAEQVGLLRRAGVGPGDTVLVGLERSVAEIVAVLGVVWAGAAYVGVEPGLPAAHLETIVAKAAPVAALVGPGAEDRFRQLDLPLVAVWDTSWAGPAGDPPGVGADGSRLAYVAFTSGSTGQPKGVAVPHRAVLRLVQQPGYVRLGAGERMLRLSALSFDASTLEIWGALLTGATLEVHPPGLPSPRELGRFLVERGVTVAWLTAGLFRLLEEFAPDSLGHLRQLLTGGDVVPHEHVRRVLTRNPGLVVTNGYGPTENTTFTTTHSVSDPQEVDGPLPIGTPVSGTQVYVLDERGRMVPPGAVGELYTGGAGLADGYLRDEAETARSFGRFSPDVPQRLYRTGDLVRIDTRGRLRFLGRRDDQVKIRGFRVELNAISDALAAHPAVHDAVVTVTDGDAAERRLVAAVVPEPDATVTPSELRATLSERLPPYLVPTLWAMVESIPVTANGKVDRRTLVAAATPTGQQEAAPVVLRPEEDDGLAQLPGLFVAAIDLPGRDLETVLDDDTDFFTVGGNSMAAVRLVRLVKERLGVKLRLRDFLLSPTPAGLRALIEKAEHE